MDKNLKRYLSRSTDMIKKDLINEIHSAGHDGTGELIKSIKVNFNGKVLEIDANDYIKYLDDGKFLKDFIKKEMNKLMIGMTKAIKQDLIEQIKK